MTRVRGGSVLLSLALAVAIGVCVNHFGGCTKDTSAYEDASEEIGVDFSKLNIFEKGEEIKHKLRDIREGRKRQIEKAYGRSLFEEE